MKLRPKQQGMALIILVFIVALVATGYLLHALNPVGLKIEQDRKTVAALAEAKLGLLGYVLTKSAENVFGYLPNPDMGQTIPFSEGDSAGSAGSKNAIVIGKLPWRSLGISPLKDGVSECLWYAVSGYFKNNPKADVINWDTQGQIDVVDRAGNILATHLAALIVSPGGVLDAQNRSKKNAGSVQCGGNYDSRNYLEPINAEGTSRISFILSDDNYDHVVSNDRFIFVTVDEIFDTLTRYSSFSAKISAFLNDEKFIAQLNKLNAAEILKGKDKGMGKVNCKVVDGNITSVNQRFCQDWLPMLLLIDLPTSTMVQIDNSAQSCNRLLIFGGRRTDGQVRSGEDQNYPENYLESSNLDAFKNPSALNAHFSGTSTFDANNPSQDILKCVST